MRLALDFGHAAVGCLGAEEERPDRVGGVPREDGLDGAEEGGVAGGGVGEEAPVGAGAGGEVSVCRRRGFG